MTRRVLTLLTCALLSGCHDVGCITGLCGHYAKARPACSYVAVLDTTGVWTVRQTDGALCPVVQPKKER